MGDSELPADLFNFQGYGEPPEVLAINEAILQQSDGGWDKIPAELRLDDAAREQIVRFLKGIAGHRVRGWKDPRMLLTYPVWRPLLPPHRIIAGFRHPASVARSLANVLGWPLERSYDLWVGYNRRLLEYTDGQPDVLWFDFDHHTQRMESWLKWVCPELGLEVTPEALAVFNRFQRHHVENELPVGHAAGAVYEELLQRACEAAPRVYTTAPTQVGVPAAIQAEEGSSVCQTIEALGRDVQLLADVQQHHNTVMQKFDRDFRTSNHHVQRLYEITNQVALRIDAAEQAWSSQREELQARMTQAEEALKQNEAAWKLVVNSRAWQVYVRLRHGYRATCGLLANLSKIVRQSKHVLSDVFRRIRS